MLVKQLKYLLPASLIWSTSVQAVTPSDVATHYANIAEAVFSDALGSAKELHKAAEKLVASPSEQTLSATQKAWLAARVPYLQSEVFRFGNPIVDDWEGQLNAWPLDEGLIDYVAANYHTEMGNIAGTANIIANPKLTLGNTTLDLTDITPALLADLNELGGSEANVATGYHAIEFLLWGQDLNGTNPGAGQRPYTDYAKGELCTHGHCERRAQYLLAATELLEDNLEFMAKEWRDSKTPNYRTELLKSPASALQKMLFGMGSLALGELAGERMKVALEAGSTEDEQDCFSDNTHHSHYYDAKGIDNIYFGRYLRSNGQWLRGASLSDLVKSKDPALDQQAQAAFAATEQALKAMVDLAEAPQSPMKFDQMIAEGNKTGSAVITKAIKALVGETQVIEKIAARLGINHLNPDSADHQF